MIPDDFSDVGEARTLVNCFGEELVFTIATNYLRYNGTYWEESEQAAVMAMIEHTDAQLSLAEKMSDAVMNEMLSAGLRKEEPCNCCVRGFCDGRTF